MLYLETSIPLQFLTHGFNFITIQNLFRKRVSQMALGIQLAIGALVGIIALALYFITTLVLFLDFSYMVERREGSEEGKS